MNGATRTNCPLSDFKVEHAAASADRRDSSPQRTPTVAGALPKVVGCFYGMGKGQIEALPKGEVPMLVRQLRRNFVLLNQSHQRFAAILKLFEPYELIYQHRQGQSQL